MSKNVTIDKYFQKYAWSIMKLDEAWWSTAPRVFLGELSMWQHTVTLFPIDFPINSKYSLQRPYCKSSRLSADTCKNFIADESHDWQNRPFPWSKRLDKVVHQISFASVSRLAESGDFSSNIPAFAALEIGRCRKVKWSSESLREPGESWATEAGA